MNFFSNVKADLNAAADNKITAIQVIKIILTPQFRTVFWFRIYSLLYKSILTKPLGYILFQRIKRVFLSDIGPSAQIGPVFVIVHLGSIVIGNQAVIGKNVTINSCVTIGEKNIRSGMPTLGDDISLGTGAKILGPISIPSHSIVGANSVVLSSFETAGIIVGSPAILKRKTI
jgi:serine O-acetyltransferase